MTLFEKLCTYAKVMKQEEALDKIIAEQALANISETDTLLQLAREGLSLKF